jgi:hypothetical protein
VHPYWLRKLSKKPSQLPSQNQRQNQSRHPKNPLELLLALCL